VPLRRLTELATNHGDELAITVVARDGTERELTWGQANRRSNQLARAFAAAGVGPGDRVAIELQNSPEFVLSAFATWKLGAVPIPMRWDLPDWERHRLLGSCRSTRHRPGHDRVITARPWRTASLPEVVCRSTASAARRPACEGDHRRQPAVGRRELRAVRANWTGRRPQTILIPRRCHADYGAHQIFRGDRRDPKVRAELIRRPHRRHRITTHRRCCSACQPAGIEKRPQRRVDPQITATTNFVRRFELIGPGASRGLA
jgi:hypothetical protein